MTLLLRVRTCVLREDAFQVLIGVTQSRWKRVAHVDKAGILHQQLRLSATAEEGGDERSEALHGHNRGRTDLELIEQGLWAAWKGVRSME